VVSPLNNFYYFTTQELQMLKERKWYNPGALFSIVLLVCLSVSLPATAKSLKVLSGFPTNHIFTEGCLGIFEDNLKKESNGAMSINIMGPDVVPMLEQFQPVQSGVFDLLFTHSAYHLGATAMGVALETTTADPTMRREAGLIELANNEYAKHDMKLLALMPMAKYNIVLSKLPRKTAPSLKGLKIRTPNAAAPLMKSLGGAPVNLPASQIYTSLQKGVIDGFSLVAMGHLDYKIHEVATYLVRPLFGYISFSLFMNKNKYDSLSADEKKWITAAAIKTEVESKVYFQKKHEEEVVKLQEHGMKIINLPESEASTLDKKLNDTLWHVSEKKSGKVIADLHKLALEKGMTK
jgi:TRAP-type C4-dicarboxylate transport system substrate-binding protein